MFHSQPHVVLKPKRDISLKRFHPWIFSGAIEKQENASVGDVVEVYAHGGEYLATGYLCPGSIAVKILSFEKILALRAYWFEVLSRAYQLRKTLGLTCNPDITAYRLVNAEGDNLPGLIVDIYDKTAVLQFHSLGMYRQQEWIIQCLKDLFIEDLDAIFCKVTETLAKEQQSLTKDSGGEVLYNHYRFQRNPVTSDQGQIVRENGYKFLVNWEHGQKTGFFIDQRENRALLGRFSPGRNVLNAFSYTGAFTIYALQGGALHVDSIDTSERALSVLKRNIELNGCLSSHTELVADCFDYLKYTEKKYDLVILDPPAFVKHKQALSSGLKGYTTLNGHTLRRIEPGGILFTFSCSQLVGQEQFHTAVFQAGLQTGRKLRILYELGQAPCHPVNIYHPEGGYLKGLVVEVV